MNRISMLACGVMMACAATVAQAQENNTPPKNVELQKQEIAKGDPARWYRDDASTEEKTRTLRKEIGAALAEAKQACGKGADAERAACLKQAQATYQRDMANVPNLAANK